MTRARKLLLGALLAFSALASGAALTEYPTFADSSYTATVTGCTTAPTVTVRYFKLSNFVALRIPATGSCVSNATSFTLTGAPVVIRPDVAAGVGAVNRVQNNSVAENAAGIEMETTGTLHLSRNGSRTGWTASGNKFVVVAVAHNYQLN